MPDEIKEFATMAEWTLRQKAALEAALDAAIQRAEMAEAAVRRAVPALRMSKRVLEDESELGDIEASFVATEMIDKALETVAGATVTGVTDAERLDWLEKFVNEHGALVLHDGNQDTGRHYGLGLRPGMLVRTLRQAIDAAMGVKR